MSFKHLYSYSIEVRVYKTNTQNVPFRPETTGHIFTPKQAPLPRYLLMRKLRRLILHYQETNQKQKLAELLQQLQGEK